MPALTLGYKASAEQFPPQRLLDLAVAAETAGFDSVWTSDHFQPWRHTDGHAPNALVWLGAASQATKRVILGTSVLTPSFRYNPAIVAQAFATLGCLAPGRVILGVGTGESMNEVPVGVDWPEQSERFARLKEAVTLIQALTAPGAEIVDFDGTYYRTHEATVYDKPDQPVPIYIAASGPAAARLAGRIADGFICTSGKGAELYTETLLPALAEGAEKAGRDASTMDRMIEMKVSFDTSLERAMEDTKVWAALALTGEQKANIHDPRDMEIAAREAEPYAHKRWLVSDDPDEHIEQIRPYLEYGFTHLVFHFPGEDQEAEIARYGELILPRLRSGLAADAEATRPGSATDGLAPVAIARQVGIALAAGLIAGAVTQLLQGILPVGVGSFANSATPWLAVAFGVGSTAPRWWLAAIAGAVTLMAALVGYYGLVQLRFGYGAELRGAVLLWLIAAVVGGPVFGVAGRWWRAGGPWLRATGPALLGASAIAEGVYLAGIPTVASAGPLFVAVGLGIPVVLGRRRDDRIRGLLLLLPCAALGAAGFVATIALYGLLTGS